mgnify:FL=1
MIQIKDLHKNFGDLVVLNGINLDFKDGEVVSILGPSGSGKSTLIRCINRLEIPDAGEIYIDDELVTDNARQLRKIRQHVGMVFQHFNLFPHMTVLKNMMFSPVHEKKEKRSDVEKHARELLKRVGLLDKADVYPGKLSGGQKQRVAIARTLAMEPDIILLDEPTSALDPEMIKEVLDVIKSLADTGITMILVTHEMSFAREVSDRILFLDDGHVVEDTTPEQFFTNPTSKRAQEFLAKMM